MNGLAGNSWRVFRAGDPAPVPTVRMALLDGAGRTWTRPPAPDEVTGAPVFAHAGTVLAWPCLPFPVVACEVPDYEAAVNRGEPARPSSDVDGQAPELLVVRENDYTAYLVCPHCEARDCVVEIYVQRRENEMDGFSLDGSQVCVQWLIGYRDQDEFHERYACSVCRKTVSRPNDMVDHVP